MHSESRSLVHRALALVIVTLLLPGCALFQRDSSGATRTTRRDKTKKGAAIGAAAGAVVGLLGEGELDEVLAGAAIGAGVGAGVGAYIDHQEERIAHIEGTTVERVGEDTLLIHFDSDVLFDVDSAILSPDARVMLDRVADVLVDYPKTAVLAQGHTDSTGSESHNQELSERRARSVVNYLIGRGVDPTRLHAIGYGEAEPVADNASAEGRRRNRRVDLLLRAKRR
jgi:outer membrane protein OmpA-like peptidoglycan-associated protein